MIKKIGTNKTKIFKIAIILLFIVMLLIMRRYEPNFKALSNGAVTLDMRFHYNSVETYKLLDTLGIEGRLLYIRILVIDFIFIVSFALVQNFFLTFVMGKALLKTRLRQLLAISYLRGFSDIIENTSVLILINKYPMEIPGVVTVSSFFTTLKFIFLGLWLISILIILVIRINAEKDKI
jgi:hypothetical protein